MLSVARTAASGICFSGHPQDEVHRRDEEGASNSPSMEAPPTVKVLAFPLYQAGEDFRRWDAQSQQYDGQQHNRFKRNRAAQPRARQQTPWPARPQWRWNSSIVGEIGPRPSSVRHFCPWGTEARNCSPPVATHEMPTRTDPRTGRQATRRSSRYRPSPPYPIAIRSSNAP